MMWRKWTNGKRNRPASEINKYNSLLASGLMFELDKLNFEVVQKPNNLSR